MISRHRLNVVCNGDYYVPEFDTLREVLMQQTGSEWVVVMAAEQTEGHPSPVSLVFDSLALRFHHDISFVRIKCLEPALNLDSGLPCFIFYHQLRRAASMVGIPCARLLDSSLREIHQHGELKTENLHEHDDQCPHCELVAISDDSTTVIDSSPSGDSQSTRHNLVFDPVTRRWMPHEDFELEQALRKLYATLEQLINMLSYLFGRMVVPQLLNKMLKLE